MPNPPIDTHLALFPVDKLIHVTRLYLFVCLSMGNMEIVKSIKITHFKVS